MEPVLSKPWMRPLGRTDPPPPGAPAEPAGFDKVRFINGAAQDDPVWLFGGLPPRDQAATMKDLNVLALSGGGAGGAFGAGALVGLTETGTRPVFDLVTGVSTGAFIAPFALLGPAWDHRLTEAYCDGHAADLLALRGLRPGASLFGAEPLTALVGRYIDAPLLAAVGAAHQAGRRLFVATANLDTEATSIWDMGAIASHGGEAALALFRDILVASASLPGLFPPKMIAVESQGRRYEEMHVDGGTISPLFVAPEPLAFTRPPGRPDRGVEVYALVNTTLDGGATTTSMSVIPILMRSFELMLKTSYRNALRTVAAFCEINGFALHTACVPADFGGVSMLRFEGPAMTDMFDRGVRAARDGRLWSTLTAPADLAASAAAS